MNYNGDFSNALYLVLILVFLVSSVVSRRDLPFAKIFKYLAIWAVVGLIGVSLYAYRYEFSDFKQRIIGEINPSKALVNNRGELVITASEDGHFYLDVLVNKIPMRFMVDTGASDVALGVSQAKKIGIDVSKLNFNKAYQTANGMIWGAAVSLNEIEVGGVKFYDVAGSVGASDADVSLLGMSFLRKFKKYEFYRDRLILTL